jgi:hypothetical protein
MPDPIRLTSERLEVRLHLPDLLLSVRVVPSLVSDLAVRMHARPRQTTVEATGYVEATPLVRAEAARTATSSVACAAEMACASRRR